MECRAIDIIQKDQVVSFTYRLSDETGKELEQSSTDAPMFYLHGYRNLLPALERELDGKAVGDELNVTLRPDQAYGYRRDDAVQRVPVKHLLTRARKYQPGMIVKVNTRQGPKDVTIIKVGKFNVDVDFNHPYADRTLTFDITVTGIRAATAEEIAHRHAHGAHGDAAH